MYERCKPVRVGVSMLYNGRCMRDANQYVLRCRCGARAGMEASVIGALASRESNGGDSLTSAGYGDRGRAWGILQVKHRILCAIFFFFFHIAYV